MTPLFSLLFGLSCLSAIALTVRAMVRHDRKCRGAGLPDHVKRIEVIGPALGNSLWVGPQAAGDADVRRVG